MAVKGILFDLDGTLLDTADLILASFKHTFRVHEQVEVDEKTLYPYLSMTLRDIFHDKGELMESMIDTYRDYHFKYYDATVKLFPNTLPALGHLHAAGIKFAAVTSRRTPSAKRGLEITGALPYFTSIVGNDRSSKHKPEPEPLYIAMRELCLKPEECVMVGDSVNDILAGKNAVTKTAAVRWTRSEWSELVAAQPDLIIDTPADFIKLGSC